LGISGIACVCIVAYVHIVQKAERVVTETPLLVPAFRGDIILIGTVVPQRMHQGVIRDMERAEWRRQELIRESGLKETISPPAR